VRAGYPHRVTTPATFTQVAEIGSNKLTVVTVATQLATTCDIALRLGQDHRHDDNASPACGPAVIPEAVIC
jgi:hypothetical protein